MFMNVAINILKVKSPKCLSCSAALVQHCSFTQNLDNKYSNEQKQKILEVMNEANADKLSGYNITKSRIKSLAQWKSSNGKLQTITDIELVDGFSEKTAAKLFDSILEGPAKTTTRVNNKIKGKVLHPNLSENIRQNCKTVLSLYVSVNSVCWALIDKSNYEILEWHYHGIDYPEGKKLLITDILDITWKVTQNIPTADIYVMKAEATTLRAAGSDPNNPKVIAVNLQKAQMVAMLVALINARSHDDSLCQEESGVSNTTFTQKVYFLRPTLPYRLYGTLVGNEKVSTDQTVEMILQSSSQKCPNNSRVFIPERLQNMFRYQKDLQKDMLGHCLLLGLTFMDLCIYKNQESIEKLIKRGE